ncbi:MAG: transposase [Betaproteobacteria bacterium]|nr:transposase [Betaproteobacteria bacterium]
MHRPTTLHEFQRIFFGDDACAAYLEAVRWPDGFSCPACGVHDDAQRMVTRPRVLRCRHCRHEVLTAGTVMHATRTPLEIGGDWLVEVDETPVGAARR